MLPLGHLDTLAPCLSFVGTETDVALLMGVLDPGRSEPCITCFRNSDDFPGLGVSFDQR